MSMETLFTEKHIRKQFHVNITYCPIMHLKNECIGTTKCFGADIIYPYVFRTLYVLNINLIYPRSLFTELHKLDFFHFCLLCQGAVSSNTSHLTGDVKMTPSNLLLWVN